MTYASPEALDALLAASRAIYFGPLPASASDAVPADGAASATAAAASPVLAAAAAELAPLSAVYAMVLSDPPLSISIGGETYVLTFADEFNGSSVSFWTGFGSGGIWTTSFSPHLDDTRTIASNGELQYYADPDMSAFPGIFTLSQGVLTINAAELDASQQLLADGMEYASGMISTELSFSASSGYIEISADVPDQTGFWSAFWLLPADGDWSAEIDIFEILGEDADTLHTNLWTDGTPDAEAVTVTGAGDGFHTYGLFWDTDTVQWYYDGTMIREAENTVTEEMYLIINLAVGGWADDPDATTDFSDGLSIDYVRVYELESDPDRNEALTSATFVPASPDVGTSASEVIDGSHWGDVIKGQGGNDTLYGDDGDDRLYGGGGADRIFGQGGDDTLNGGSGADHLIGGSGEDVLDGGTGTDHLWGGSYGPDGSSDRFVFATGRGTDYIHDFEAGLDLVDLRSFATDWTSVLSALDDQGWAVKLDLQSLGGNGGDVVYLVDVTLAELGSDSFLLA
ncbi:family 16 glycosylhydrolase [Mangrovicoccus sp. HB161399]|uniref:family 16 glycosylhydrolase n=1 Tax=Mangrovicoccus sp. HB161399 TaxID=2720392 RepID=UPI0015538621|nr:family 16 glycosylhydrolase [Mangrovicoccus sp. HB161399]